MAQGKKTGLYNSKGDHLLEKLEEAGLSEFELEKVLNDETDDLAEGMLEGMRAKWLGIDLSKAPKKKNQTKTSELSEFAQTLAKRLSCQLNNRFEEFGAPANFNIKPSQMPKGLTFEHLDAIKELYPGAFEPRYLPTAADLRNLDKVYVDVMFPKTQRQKDKDNGLVSFRPNWWDDNVDWGIGKFSESRTKGQSYIASMHYELQSIGGSLVLLDTAWKPHLHNGNYESVFSAKDPLLPLFKEVFGAGTNRFSYSWDRNMTLAARLKEKIKDKFLSLNLPSVDFEVMAVPAVLENIELTTVNRVSSTTDTSEWTSTPLVDDNGVDTGRRLSIVKYAEGGASMISSSLKEDAISEVGIRLAVVFKKGK